MMTNSNEQEVVKARREIEKYKKEYMNSLQKNGFIQKNAGQDDILEVLLDCQRKGNEYFNYVENLVGDSGLLGAHQNGLWITGFAEDCYAILESLVKHFQFLRSYADDITGFEKNIIEPTHHAYANMQRLVKEYLPKQQSTKLKELFYTNDLPIGGFVMPAVENSEKIERWQKILGIILGCLLLISTILLSFTFSNPTKFQIFIMRGMFALALSFMTAFIPGFIHLTSKLRIKGAYFVIVAGGAIAIFVIIYLINPPSI